MTNIIKISLFLGLTFVNSFSQNITLSTDSNSATEGESITMTATLDAAIGSDVKVSLSIAGDATADSDYTTSFASLGEETAVGRLIRLIMTTSMFLKMEDKLF